MKRIIAISSFVVAISACSATQLPKTFTALEAGEASACIIANALAPDVPAVLAACKLGPEFTQLASQVLVASKASLSLAGAK